MTQSIDNSTVFDSPAAFVKLPIAVAMGIFDGVHIGHQAIISHLAAIAAECHAIPVAMFFNPHPSLVLGHTPPLQLTDLQSKSSLLLQHGAEKLICMPFTRELSQMSPIEFLDCYFGNANIKAFCVGSNWRFGRMNSGDTHTLSDWASSHDIQAHIVPQICIGNQVVSSTRIRQEIADGNLDNAMTMLGRRFSIAGEICHGNGIGGRDLSCPTANIAVQGHAIPPYGVYGARAFVDDKQEYGIVYVGEAPTIRSTENPIVLVELHLFNIDCDLYGKNITVEFHNYLRPSIKFASKQELMQQIQKDIAQTKSFFKL